MLRLESVHARGEAEFLDDAIFRLANLPRLKERADLVLRSAARQEPVFAEALHTPQSPPYHAEGPFLEDHLRLQLLVLYGIATESFHLIDIEEFRREKGLEGEIDELEEQIKESLGFFEAFILCHDLGKRYTLLFDSLPGSRGEGLGFCEDQAHHRQAIGPSEREKMRKRYADLFDEFSSQHPLASAQEVQHQFFVTYGIVIHNPGHERVVHSPVHRALLARMAEAQGCTPREIALLEDIIAHHLNPLADFQSISPEKMRTYYKLAEARGYDADDFLDLFQACVFFDTVVGTMQRAEHGYWHNPLPLINFMRSEYAHAPERAQKRAQAREQEEGRRRNKIFQEAGLDGVALMELLRMEPGPQLGKTLKQIHRAVLGKEPLPSFGSQTDKELAARAERFYERWFEKDV